MVKIASGYARAFENVKFILANAAELPFEDDSIDFIISTGSFHHWKHPLKIFNEFYRVLKTKGEAWIYDGCSNPPNEEASKLKRKYGGIKYLILTKIQKFHGFNWEEYNTKIKNLLGQTQFKSNFKMVLTGGWMKIILKK
jgi:ubiquinone/menaquinone biosynthesis C-methylase UbiE